MNGITFPQTPEGIMQQTKNVQLYPLLLGLYFHSTPSFLRVWREKRALCHISAEDDRAFILFFSAPLPTLKCLFHSHHCLLFYTVFTLLSFPLILSPLFCLLLLHGVCLESAAVTQSLTTVTHTHTHTLINVCKPRCCTVIGHCGFLLWRRYF